MFWNILDLVDLGCGYTFHSDLNVHRSLSQSAQSEGILDDRELSALMKTLGYWRTIANRVD